MYPMMRSRVGCFVCALLALLCICTAQAGAAEVSSVHPQASSTVVPASAEAVLLVAFGTSVPEAKGSLDALDSAYRASFASSSPIFWAYTSDIIRRKLAKEGTTVFSVRQALEACAASGARTIRVQSLHITPAEEYRQLERMLVEWLTLHPGTFDHVYLGVPLLESERDLEATVQAVLAALAEQRRPGDAVVFMAHGNDRGPGDITIRALAEAMHQADSLAFVASVEGARSFERILPELQARKVKRVWLQPFMLVAGDHARNDLTGAEEDSWASQLRRVGIEPLSRLQGLGEFSAIRDLFLRHTRQTTDDLAHSRKKD